MAKVTSDHPRDRKCSFDAEIDGMPCRMQPIAILTLALSQSHQRLTLSDYAACDGHIEQAMTIIANQLFEAGAGLDAPLPGFTTITLSRSRRAADAASATEADDDDA